MPPKRGGEGSKKAQGQARKAEAAAGKKANEEAQKAAAEAKTWDVGAKDSSKKEAAAAKAAEAARKKAERDALEAEEMASIKTVKSSKSAKAAPKKPARGLDAALADSLGEPSDKKGPALNATGIDNALDALSLTGSNNNAALDRHPERRFKAAYNAYEERRLDEMKDDKTLRKQQKIERIRKEFEKSPENPFNQLSASYNMSKEEIADLKKLEKDSIEKRLASS